MFANFGFYNICGMKTNDFQLELQKRYPVIVGKFDNEKVDLHFVLLRRGNVIL